MLLHLFQFANALLMEHPQLLGLGVQIRKHYLFVGIFNELLILGEPLRFFVNEVEALAFQVLVAAHLVLVQVKHPQQVLQVVLVVIDHPLQSIAHILLDPIVVFLEETIRIGRHLPIPELVLHPQHLILFLLQLLFFFFSVVTEFEGEVHHGFDVEGDGAEEAVVVVAALVHEDVPLALPHLEQQRPEIVAFPFDSLLRLKAFHPYVN
mmetsp:Transcript_3687/g.3620  ORF Transcript_3687/g.3620 Transcript_3687/m.3620 type:complete len:208 (-) Transcript_3687:22-645(-)